MVDRRRRRITTVNIKISIFQIVKHRLRQSILKYEFFSIVSSTKVYFNNTRIRIFNAKFGFPFR